jgi:uncharacterized RDD family membrane protein YckC
MSRTARPVTDPVGHPVAEAPAPPQARAPSEAPAPPAAAPDSRFPWHAAPLPPTAPPSGRELDHGRPAGVVTRAVANAVDVALVSLVLALAYAGWSGFRFLLAPTSFRLLALQFQWIVVAVGIGLVLYWTVTWSGPGRTHGDQLMGLRVVGPSGAKLHLLHAAARAVLCVVFLPGLFWVLVSRRNRSVQDLVLRTAVVYD